MEAIDSARISGLYMSATFLQPPEVIQGRDCEENQRDYLEDKTSDHHVRADLQHVTSDFGSSSNATSGSLQNQSAEIAREEDARIPLGLDARDGRIDVQDHVLQHQVDGGGVEDGGKCEATNLERKSRVIPWVAMQHDSADVAYSHDVSDAKIG